MLQNLKRHYYFKGTCNNWIQVLLSLMNSFSLLLFCIIWNFSFYSYGVRRHNCRQRFNKALYFCLRSTWQGEMMQCPSRRLGIFSNNTHTNASFCTHFACWSQDTSSFLSDLHHSTSQNYWRSTRETGVTLKVAYFPIVIWASLVKKTTFILVSRFSLLWRIFSSLGGLCFPHYHP